MIIHIYIYVRIDYIPNNFSYIHITSFSSCSSKIIIIIVTLILFIVLVKRKYNLPGKLHGIANDINDTNKTDCSL